MNDDDKLHMDHRVIIVVVWFTSCTIYRQQKEEEEEEQMDGIFVVVSFQARAMLDILGQTIIRLNRLSNKMKNLFML